MFEQTALAGRKRQNRFRPVVELLEDRVLLSNSTGTISGKVLTAGAPWEHAEVRLFQTGETSAVLIGTAETDHVGRYSIDYATPELGASLYLVASEGDPASSQVIFISVAGEVGDNLLRTVDINELTTVASVFALSQFIHEIQVYGPSPGLDNAVAVTFNLVNAKSGQPGTVISDFNNGDDQRNPISTLALQTQNTLANMLAASAADASDLATFFSLTTIDGVAPTNTIQAVHNIARHPFGLDNDGLLALANSEPVFGPGLLDVPDDWVWVIALHYTKGGFNAPGRIAFDSEGNLWSNNNFMPPGGSIVNRSGRQVTALDPQGKPILGSPIFTQSVLRSGYGVAIDQDDNVWISNFDDGGITKFSPDGKKLLFAPGTETGLNHPMGMAFDQDGNLWIPNMGDPSDPLDNGSVTVFLQGDPNQRRTYTHSVIGPAVGLVRKPFSLAIDGAGRAWVADGAGPAPGGSVTVLRLNDNDDIVFVHQINSDALSTPINPDELRPFGLIVTSRTIAIDSGGNAWVNNFEASRVTFIDGGTFAATDYDLHPLSRGWGLAVDGDDVVWAASFTNPVASGRLMEPPIISVVQGAGADRGDLLFSFSNSSLQHLTALQIDASGNVWVANNWSLATTPDPLKVYGGDGVVQFVGLAVPVVTPLIGPPVKPTASQSSQSLSLDEQVSSATVPAWWSSATTDFRSLAAFTHGLDTVATSPAKREDALPSDSPPNENSGSTRKTDGLDAEEELSDNDNGPLLDIASTDAVFASLEESDWFLKGWAISSKKKTANPT